MIQNSKALRDPITKRKLRPYIDRSGFWDGHTALDSEGVRHVMTGDSMIEMRRMVKEGYWGYIDVRLRTLEEVESHWLKELGDIMDTIWL